MAHRISMLHAHTQRRLARPRGSTRSAAALTVFAGLATLLAGTGAARGQAPDCVVPEGACADYDCMKQAFFGDLHIHTSYSLDSYVAGGNRNSPMDAYAFARGEVSLPIASGVSDEAGSVRLSEPLDFAAVTDHSEFFTLTGLCHLSDVGPLACRSYERQGSLGQSLITLGAALSVVSVPPRQIPMCTGLAGQPAACEEAARTTWQKLQLFANSAYERCELTTFPAYEWTAQTLTTNLHRNVIFGSDAVPASAFDYINYPTPLQLWRALEAECKEEEGCDVVTIPHNSNFSLGTMWSTAEDPEALEYMRRYQVAVEIYQHKGASECLPEGPYGDEGCDFEIVRSGNLFSTLMSEGGTVTTTDPRGYVRSALAEGLKQQQETGENPLQLGFIGSTDTHNGTSGYVDEAAWFGHLGTTEATPAARLENSLDFSPGGLTGVWAEENSREAIFAAIKRRETFATSGPRIRVRFYAVPGLDDGAAARLCADPAFPADVLARAGEPMGAKVDFAGPPTLVVSALSDEAALSTIEVIRMTTAADGTVQVHAHRQTLSAEMQYAPCIAWRDSEYDGGSPALYYARVLEEPTPRWSSYDCERAPELGACASGAESGAPPTIQERAWTSPIFFR